MNIVIIITVICIAMILFTALAQGEIVGRYNPLIDPQPITTYATPANKIYNVLLLGIDKSDAAAARGYDYHTDAIMVLAINHVEKKVDMISIPRDTLTYVPGIKGIYKLNAAINCGGGKTREGVEKICEAVSWALGGIKIDYYCAVDMKAMEVIGGTIGGVDFVLETRIGNYYKGLQHLDGKGIVAYLSTRRYADVNANDIGRTGRQRELIWAIFKKIISDKGLVAKVIFEVQQLNSAFFTNMRSVDILNFIQMAKELDDTNVGSHVLTGKYRTALLGWNFTFTDQEHRKKIIKQVYGVEVPELKYVSYEYTKWLVEHGFRIVRYISVAELLRDEIGKNEESTMSIVKKEALASFNMVYTQLQDAFDKAADSMSTADTEAMIETGKELRKQGDDLYKLFDGIDKPIWVVGNYWYADRMINEIDVNFR